MVQLAYIFFSYESIRRQIRIQFASVQADAWLALCDPKRCVNVCFFQRLVNDLWEVLLVKQLSSSFEKIQARQIHMDAEMHLCVSMLYTLTCICV